MSIPCRARRYAIALVAAAGTLAGAATGEARAEPLSEVASWLQEYLRFDTTNPPGNEGQAAAFLASVLQREGIASRLLVNPRGRVSLYARLEGASSHALLLTHHLDVVEAGPGWTSPAFAALLERGALVGRGALDAKSLGIAEVAAMIDLKRRGAKLRRSVILLAVPGEETGGIEGTAFALERYPELFRDIDLVLNEGGSNRVTPEGRVGWWGIEVAQKRPLWLRVQAHGRGGHAAGLQPFSAAHQLIEALARVLALPPTYRVTPPVRAYLAALAPLHGGAFGDTLAHIDRAITPQGPREALLPGMASLFLDTVQITVLRGSQQINVIPAAASADIDVRLLPDTDAAQFLARVRSALGAGVEAEVLLGAPVGAASSATSDDYTTLARALGTETPAGQSFGPHAPVVPAFIAGFTDSRYFRERGIPAYGISPFALPGEALRGIHGPDERIPLAELDRGTARLRRVVAALVEE